MIPHILNKSPLTGGGRCSATEMATICSTLAFCPARSRFIVDTEHRLLILLLFQFRVLTLAFSVFLSVQLCCIAFTLWNRDDGSKPPFGSNPMVVIAPKLSSVNTFSTSLDRVPKPVSNFCASSLVRPYKRKKAGIDS